MGCTGVMGEVALFDISSDLAFCFPLLLNPAFELTNQISS